MRLKRKKREIKAKTREERFKKVASRRVQEILKKMRLLRNCANKRNYTYTDEQARKVINAVESEWKDVKSEFNKHKSKKEFKL